MSMYPVTGIGGNVRLSAFSDGFPDGFASRIQDGSV